MESELSADKENPPVPIKTYEWEDARRARDAGGYPWTHLSKPPLEINITAETILRETTPRRSMSREFSKSRTHSPVDSIEQKILNLDSSPGSSRKHDDDGKDEGINIPNFSKEISQDSDSDKANMINVESVEISENKSGNTLTKPMEMIKSVSPKGILKRRHQEKPFVSLTETREKTKCCHPLVNKIKHLADKTLHKLEDAKASLKKETEGTQEIRNLKTSPGAVKRHKFSAVKLGDSDEMSKSFNDESICKRKEHIYEDIEDSKVINEKVLQFTEDKSTKNNQSKEIDYSEKKSNASQDPSLVNDESNELKPEDYIMEKLHSKNNNMDDMTKEALILEDISNIDDDEPNIDEVFENQLLEENKVDTSPNITITEVLDDGTEHLEENQHPIIDSSPSSQQDISNSVRSISDVEEIWSKTNRCTSEGGVPFVKPIRPSREGSVRSYTPEVRCACQYFQCDSLLPERSSLIGTRSTSRASNYNTYNATLSDHEYEIIEKPKTSKPDMENTKPEDDLSSTNSLDRKYLQQISDEEDISDHKNYSKNNDVATAKEIQKNIEERFFISTPSSMSRTECDISTSQVDSSALENLPLKRENRPKNSDTLDQKIQQRLREGTGKLKSQAGKLKIKLQNIKSKHISMPERPRLPDRPKFKTPERPKVNFTEKAKAAFPDRAKFKKINFAEKFSIGDRKKFTFPERPKLSVPDISKFKLPHAPKMSFSSLGRKKFQNSYELSDDTPTKIDYETKTYPRIFKRNKNKEIITSSSPTINRDDTPSPVFTFTRMKNKIEKPLEETNYQREGLDLDSNLLQDENTNLFVESRTVENEIEKPGYSRSHDYLVHEQTTPSQHDYQFYINEINNDEFFVRPRGISSENIHVREYLSDEIRQAFNIPRNALAMMNGSSHENEPYNYENDEADPELMMGEETIHNIVPDEDPNEKDDGYYTFPPIRPSREKKKYKQTLESVKYIDEITDDADKFRNVDLTGSKELEPIPHCFDNTSLCMQMDTNTTRQPEKACFPEYNNGSSFMQSQTLPMPPNRRRRSLKKNMRHSTSAINISDKNSADWNKSQENDMVVYRTEHEYVLPENDITATEPSPIAPRRSRIHSRSSHGTSAFDDDRTSHGAESLTMDTHISQIEDSFTNLKHRGESPGYATVDKTAYQRSNEIRRSKSKTPPIRPRKSRSLERKYYTVGSKRADIPNRPPRKKSSTSLVTLDSLTGRSSEGTQYVEIDEPFLESVNKDLESGEILSKMKDRPLPPPPRPPRGPKIKKYEKSLCSEIQSTSDIANSIHLDQAKDKAIEIEVSTQTDPLPDDVDYELTLEENLDISCTSSLKDLNEDHSHKSQSKLTDISSRPMSMSEKSFMLSDPKLSEISKSSLGRTSPTVILVERRVSSPTRINNHEEMLTEASLTVQHIDVNEENIPEIPPLPFFPHDNTKSNVLQTPAQKNKNIIDKLESQQVELNNLITQRLRVTDLDVDRLNVSELQASKIFVSDIEGMTLQVTELDAKSGHISVSGIEFSQNIIDEIVQKFTQLSSHTNPQQPEISRPMSREEETQTDAAYSNNINNDPTSSDKVNASETTPTPPPRPPLPDLAPLLVSYLQDLSMSPSPMYHARTPRDRPFTEFHESHYQPPAPPSRRVKRRTNTAPLSSDSSSGDDAKRRLSPRRLPPVQRSHEPSITEAGAQFLRVCHNSIARSMRNILNLLMSYISGNEDKRDVQMALVIFLVLIAGLIMFGLSDSRTIHHHHWEFFNPPDNKPT